MSLLSSPRQVTAVVGAALIVGLVLVLLVRARSGDRPEPPAPEPAAPPAADPTPPAAPLDPVAAAQAARAADEAALPGLRDVDRLILLDFHGKAIGTERIEDASPGKPYRVEVHQDAGQARTNRILVDLDRDGQWDERWTLSPEGAITRETAPADDAVYSVAERFDGAVFVAAP